MENNEVDYIKLLNPDKLEEVQLENPGAFIHLHKTKDDKVVEDNLYIGECRVTDNFNIGDMDERIKTNKVGGLESTTLGDLKNKSVSEIIIGMVCPLMKPTITTKPSLTISYSGSKVIRTGTVLPSKDDFTTTINRGKWSDGTIYAGAFGLPELTMSPDNWSGNSTEGTYTISGIVAFSEGLTPKDTHNNFCPELRYLGGEVRSNEIKIKAVQPIYINNVGIDVMSELIVDYNELQVINVEIPKEIDGTLDKFKIFLPYKFSTFEVKQYNSVSGKYDINIEMKPIEGFNSRYIRTNDVKDTITDIAKYEIKLKK